MSNDVLGLIVSYVYAFGLLGIIEFIGKKMGWPIWVTRKLTHIGAGMWVWGILYFFDNWEYGIIPFASFIVLNYIFYRFKIFKAMDEEESTPGTVYFAISITLLFILFWETNGQPDYVFVAVAGVMAMTWGDAFASLIGKAFGKKTYTVFGHTRTWEGSLTMFAVSYLAIGITMQFLPGSELSPLSVDLTGLNIWAVALPAALVATLAEAFAPEGTDNLSVPLFTALVIRLFV
ncbi:MAG TPA: phosphatidate cytidylyltransferase [Caldithrix abyssi]|uniref:Phosphatidate cytidylyltransferase n=1 Tax=Caldithrix abyssi TaxID=187145 RepID=A0A7V4WVF2_CALAY|nr:phosphatidate cytidylyltransferase [Caldithrix abyssi]